MKKKTNKISVVKTESVLLIDAKLKALTAQSYEDSDSFCQSLLNNKQSASKLKNKSLVSIASRTYANSVLRKNDALTETSVIDIALAVFTDRNEQATLQMISEFIENEFTMRITATRIRKHINDNKKKINHFFKENVNVLEHDVISFSSKFVSMCN